MLLLKKMEEFSIYGSGEGLLQLNNMPQLETDMTFKLWLVSKSGTFSLGKFEVKPDKKYMPITEIPFVLTEDIEMFTVTKENKENTSVTPNGETILFWLNQKRIASKQKNAEDKSQIEYNILAINTVAQETAIGVEEIALASKGHNRLTKNLQLLISKYRLSNFDNANVGCH